MDNDLFWFRKNDKSGKDDLYEVNWTNKDGKERIDYFTTHERAKAIWGDICTELSWVHIWAKPEMGVRAYLQHLPLDLVEIIKI
jgi:hypothetical protein